MGYKAATRARVGIVGCGNISEKYVRGMGRYSSLELAGCASRSITAAEKLAAFAGVTAYPTVAALIGDPSIDVVVNLTLPIAHAEVSLAALRGGKHVYVEKPLATTFAEGKAVVDTAEEEGRILGVAPDTFLGSAVQTAAAALDKGLVGQPIGAAAFASYTGAEMWHPDPSLLFKRGGGPVLDQGPYYVTALVACLGFVASVGGYTRFGAPTRRYYVSGAPGGDGDGGGSHACLCMPEVRVWRISHGDVQLRSVGPSSAPS